VRKLVLNSGVLKELPDLQPKHYRQVVGAIFDLLSDPSPHYSKQVQGTPYRRIAVGEYRVVYRYDDESVYVVVCGKRNDDEVYRRLERLKAT
jgi:mRNA interferase RelE/StbE